MLSRTKSKKTIATGIKVGLALYYIRTKQYLDAINLNLDVYMAIFRIKSIILYKPLEIVQVINAYCIVNNFFVLPIRLYLHAVISLMEYTSILLSKNSLYKNAAENLNYVSSNLHYAENTEIQFHKNWTAHLLNLVLTPVYAWIIFIFYFTLISICLETLLKKHGCRSELLFEPELVTAIQSDNVITLIEKYKDLLANNSQIAIKSMFYRTPREHSLYYLANAAGANKTKKIISAYMNRLDPLFNILHQLTNTKGIPQDVTIRHLLPFINVKDILYMYKNTRIHYILGFIEFEIDNEQSSYMNNFIDTEILTKHMNTDLTHQYSNYLLKNEDRHNRYHIAKNYDDPSDIENQKHITVNAASHLSNYSIT